MISLRCLILCNIAELKELVSLHGEQEPFKGGEVDSLVEGTDLGAALTRDEVTIIKGALDLSSKTVKDAMTPISEVFMLGFKDKLDEKKMDQVQISAAFGLVWLEWA